MVQENCLNGFVLVICGPTGSGKSDLAVKLANILNGEIISADSIAIYKDLNIGAAKPSLSQQKCAKHHLIDVCSPFDNFTVTDYQKKAEPIIKQLLEAGKIPIICGGTGFYINSLLFDLSYGNCGKSEEIREYYQKIYKEKGALYLHSLLKEKDLITAEKLHPNDVKRVVRALEIFDISGKQKSVIIDKIEPKFKYFAFSYDFERSALYDRINKRVDIMFDNGLVNEVKYLIGLGLNLSNQSMQGIGYKEFFEFDSIDENLENIKEKIKLNSRRYAKRQITFFKKLEGLKLLTYENVDISAKKVVETIKNELQ